MDSEHKFGGGASAPRALLTEADFRALLGGMSERKFQALRAEGVIPAPLELGPRAPRWTHDDFWWVVSSLPRREKAPEPQRLQDGRRARIERMTVTGR